MTAEDILKLFTKVCKREKLSNNSDHANEEVWKSLA